MKKPAEVRVLCILSCLLLAHQVSAFSQTFGISPQGTKEEDEKLQIQNATMHFDMNKLLLGCVPCLYKLGQRAHYLLRCCCMIVH